MLRPLLIVVCLMACVGCSSAQRSLKPTADAKGATPPKEEAPPKEYDWKDLSTGSSSFYRH